MEISLGVRNSRRSGRELKELPGRNGSFWGLSSESFVTWFHFDKGKDSSNVSL